MRVGCVLSCYSDDRARYYPLHSALGVDNATHYTTINVVRMAKALLLTGPGDLAIAHPPTHARAQAALIAVAIANHRLFQQRQRILWPQLTALDLTAATAHAITARLAGGSGGGNLYSTLPYTASSAEAAASAAGKGVPMMEGAGCSAEPHELPLPQ